MDKLVLSTSEFYILVNIDEIVYCKSQNSYTTFFFVNEKPVKVSVSIKKYQEQLSNFDFFRPHQSYLVNLHFVKGMQKSGARSIILTTGEHVPVSSRNRKYVTQIIQEQ